MKLILRSLLFFVCAFATACSSGHIGAEFARRDGPQFADAFPDVNALVTLDDTDEARALLATVPLPETDEHHAELRALLERTQELDTGHLLLLVEAVALGHESNTHTSYFTTEAGKLVSWGRGSGAYASVVDELLLAGVAKLRDPSPKHLGELLSKTQTKETTIELAQLCAKMDHALDWDDGSSKDLKAILRAAQADRVRLEYCIDVLLPNGQLDESRADIAMRSLNFDSGRTELIIADYGRRSSLTANTLLEHAKLMDFDSGLTSVVEHGAPLLTKIDGTEALELVQIASFDSGRTEIVELVAEHIDFQSSPDVLAIMQTASFDSGRAKILGVLAEGSFMELDGDDLIEFVQTANFDSGKFELMALLKPHVRSPLSAGELRNLLGTSSFDSGRMQVAELFASSLRRIPAEERLSILDCFSFESGKRKLRSMLDW